MERCRAHPHAVQVSPSQLICIQIQSVVTVEIE